MYETKIEEKRTGKIIGAIGYITVILVVGVLGYTVIENYKSKGNEVVVEKKEKVIKEKKDSSKKKDIIVKKEKRILRKKL